MRGGGGLKLMAGAAFFGACASAQAAAASSENRANTRPGMRKSSENVPLEDARLALEAEQGRDRRYADRPRAA